jgi:hypothetical protein
MTNTYIGYYRAIVRGAVVTIAVGGPTEAEAWEALERATGYPGYSAREGSRGERVVPR